MRKILIIVILIVNFSDLLYSQVASIPITISEPGSFVTKNVVDYPDGSRDVVIVCICSEAICYTITANPSGTIPQLLDDNCDGEAFSSLNTGTPIEILVDGNTYYGNLIDYENNFSQNSQFDHIIKILLEE